MERRLNSEAAAGWLAADAEAATKIAAATEAEVAFNKSIAGAEAAHATARALDDAVKAKVDAGESPPVDDLIKREAAEEAARVPTPGQPSMLSPSPRLQPISSLPQRRLHASALMPRPPISAPSPPAR